MVRRLTETTASVRTDDRPKRKKLTAPAKDTADAENPTGGWMHVATELEHIPTAEELAVVDLRGKFPPRETPALVVYGRRLQVMSLMVSGEPDFNIIEFCGRNFSMSRTQTRLMIWQIRQSWNEDFTEQAKFARSDAVARIRRDLSSMRTAQVKDWAAINRHENLLMKLEGTAAPVQVNVFDVNAATRDALVRVIGGYSDEELRSMAVLTEGAEVNS